VARTYTAQLGLVFREAGVTEAGATDLGAATQALGPRRLPRGAVPNFFGGVEDLAPLAEAAHAWERSASSSWRSRSPWAS